MFLLTSWNLQDFIFSICLQIVDFHSNFSNRATIITEKSGPSPFSFFFIFSWSLFSIIFKQHTQIITTLKPMIKIIAIILCSMINTHTQDTIFLKYPLYFPFPMNTHFYQQQSEIRAQALVYGAQRYNHIVNDFPPVPPINRPDIFIYTKPYGSAQQYVIIYEAIGLAKVQISLFRNGRIRQRNFGIVGQFNKGFTFFEIQTNQSCSIKAQSQYWPINQKFSFISSKSDAFNTSLPQFKMNSGQIIRLPRPGRHYLRFQYDPNKPISNHDRFFLIIKTLSNDTCLNSCPYSQTSVIYLQSTTSQNCRCYLSGFFFDTKKSKCIDCQNVVNTDEVCISTLRQICGNGVREGSEECDNDNNLGCSSCQIVNGYICKDDQFNSSECQMCGNGIKQGSQQCDNKAMIGCSVCIVQKGYQCQENQAKLSDCQLKQPQNNPDSTQNQDFINKDQGCSGSDCNQTYKVIIGVCLGVGGAFAFGLAIFCIIRTLKNKQQVNLEKSKKTNHEKEQPIDSQQKIDSRAVIL